MEERLVRKLAADPKRRFIHAYLLAKAGRVWHADLVVPILVGRLRDNRIRNDALMSMDPFRAR